MSILFLLVVVALAAALVLVYRRHVIKPGQPEGGTLAREHPPRLPDLLAIPLSPLRELSFDESLDGQQLAAAIEKNVSHALTLHARQFVGDALAVPVHIGALGQGGYVVTFQTHTGEFLRNADGTYKAAIRGPDGRIAELGELNSTATWLGRFSQATALIITVSHIISGADLSRRLARVEGKLDQLLAYREIDQYSKLRTAYEELRKSLNCVEIDTLQVGRVGAEVRRVRHVLLRESQHDARALPPLRPQSWWLKSKLQEWTSRENAPRYSRRVRDLDRICGKMTLAAYCLRLESIAAAFEGKQREHASLLKEAAADFTALSEMFRPLEAELAGERLTPCVRADTARSIAEVLTVPDVRLLPG